MRYLYLNVYFNSVAYLAKRALALVKTSAISAFCRSTTQTLSITNCLVAIIHAKPVNYNFSPKIGCHGNDP